MLWNDLRDYLQRLDQLGELKVVRGAHWNLELGAISELFIERGGPCLLFDEIVDYPPGYRVIANVERTASRLAVAFGLDPDKPFEDLAAEWNELVGRYELVPPEVVAHGPVFENVMTGDDIDLLRFPTPLWHEKDGNRYIGTGVAVIQEDPDTGWVNAGSYRVAVHDSRTAILFIEPTHHGDDIRKKFWAAGKRAPVVISAGQEPILTALAGSIPLHPPEGVSELEVAGYFNGAPYQVVKGPVTGIPFPATAELVIEGYMPSPEEALIDEGPFGEWTGYYAHGRTPETPVEIAAIYYRNDPIIYGSPPQRPVKIHRELGNVDVATKRRLERSGIRGVEGCFALAKPGLRVVSIKQMYDEHVDDVIRALEPGGDGFMGNRTWVIVDEDIDITSPHEVLWAIASRLIPEHGVTLIPGTADWQLDPRIPPGGRSDPTIEGRKRYSAHNLVLNCCRPYAWKDVFPPVNVNSRELRRQTEEKWKNLLREAGIATV